jgi:hypothetical protein
MRVAPRPAPETARLVQLSCQRLLVIEPKFAGAFHHELCGLVPHSLPAIGAGRALAGGLAHCLLWAALTRDPTDVVEDRVRSFASDQHGRGFPDDAYPCLCHALLRSVRSTLPAGWTSELSSGWVSYGLWLQPHLERGASATPDASGRPAAERPTSLEGILKDLRARYFPGQDRALNSICTRVMLRTGADIRAPRPEQGGDPRVIADVLDSLLLMGFAPATGPGASVPAVPGAAPDPALKAVHAVPDDSGSAPRHHWGHRGPWGWRRHRPDPGDQLAHHPQH